MTREKMIELLALLNPHAYAPHPVAKATDREIEFALFHEAYHIKVQRDQQINTTFKKD